MIKKKNGLYIYTKIYVDLTTQQWYSPKVYKKTKKTNIYNLL